MKGRGQVKRVTRETSVEVDFKLEGAGTYRIETTVPFFDHMLSLFAKHGFFDLTVQAHGDTEVDFHHLVEDVGISMGEALVQALGGKEGICRFGSATVPMIDALASVHLDLSRRAHLVFDAVLAKEKVGGFDLELVEEFLRAFSSHGGIDLHVNLHYGSNSHHAVEAVFKALARALDSATQKDRRVKGVLSTKGKL
ncbi:MAG: imidazoleglycerol-phosphate dehydratase HisB [Candidatus Tectomicrobia bacterium]|uniref:Imidazoleglycerol-phosphate dehydratase n=1 Tax=Tectimicrobiota bacterium TaxID=2528274 RepID=A0A932M177_UNCTE|nr:imidazoleglycerol-phosphate dehydratase HisB [Candidatus Tectomicrobia bacterium]